MIQMMSMKNKRVNTIPIYDYVSFKHAQMEYDPTETHLNLLMNGCYPDAKTGWQLSSKIILYAGQFLFCVLTWGDILIPVLCNILGL